MSRNGAVGPPLARIADDTVQRLRHWVRRPSGRLSGHRSGARSARHA